VRLGGGWLAETVNSEIPRAARKSSGDDRCTNQLRRFAAPFVKNRFILTSFENPFTVAKLIREGLRCRWRRVKIL
jgi:hypothetical protein